MNAAGIDRERELCLLLARPDLTGEEAGRIGELLAKGLQWRVVDSLVSFHLLTAPFWKAVEHSEGIPAELQDQLRKRCLEGAMRNLQLTAAAVRLQALCESAGVPLLVIKGPVLAVDGYGSLNRRWFSDIDLLVRRRDAVTAIRLLESKGLRPLFPMQGRWPERFVARFYELSFFDSSNGSIDLHWSLIDSQFSFCPTEDEVWSSTRTIDVDGRRLKTLSAEMTAKYLCLHLAKHHWDRLGWLSDVAHWIERHPETDWTALAGDERAGRFVLITLGLIDRLLQRKPPAGTGELIERDEVVRRQIEAVDARLLREAIPTVTQTPQWRTEYARAMPGRLDRWRSFYTTLFRPSVKEWRSVPLPEWLSFLYVLIRPMNLFWKRVIRREGATEL